MISDLDEVRRVRALILVCEAELNSEGVDCAMFELGLMIETPAAVLQADAMFAEVSLFSIELTCQAGQRAGILAAIRG